MAVRAVQPLSDVDLQQEDDSLATLVYLEHVTVSEYSGMPNECLLND